MNVSRITAPWFFRRSGNARYLSCLEEVEANQWRSAAELREIQQRKLSRVLVSAARTVPYYRSLFNELGVNPSTLDVDTIRTLPFLTKSIIQARGHELLADGLDPKALINKSSSGSSGRPTVVYADHLRGDYGWAYNTRHNRWAGLDWGKRVASLWGRPDGTAVQLGALSRVGRARRTVRAALTGEVHEVWTDPFQLTDESMERFARDIRDFRPHIMLGYANAIGEFARYVESAGVHGIELEAIISGGEVLYPEVRERVERVFGVKVFERYGTREVDILASACEHGSLHVNDDNLLVELVAEAGNPFGRLVVTDLNNTAMPLIRYDLEDYATRYDGACACGRGLSLFASLDGRRFEIMPARNGALVHGIAFNRLVMNLRPVVLNFQIHQRDYSLFDVKYVAEGSIPTEMHLAPLVTEMRRRFGDDAQINIERVTDIERATSGKLRFVFSDLTGRPT